jgi:hypothetical protein
MGVGVICALVMTVGSLAGQDSTARVLTSKDITAEIGTDVDARSVVQLVLSYLMAGGHDHREFFLASQIPVEWLPSIPGVEFVRLADAEIDAHLSACGEYWRVAKVARVNNVVSMGLDIRCGASQRDFIVSLEENLWHLGPPGAGKDGGGWAGGIGSGFVGGPPPGCPCLLGRHH